ncbi:hypothetical protein ACTFIZ_004948 [Dictyostelium cf. discoideum]
MKRAVAFLSLFMCLVVIACCIVSIVYPWYIVSFKKIGSDDRVKYLYYWDEIRNTDEKLNATNIINTSSNSDSEKYDDLGYDHIKNVFIVSLAFLCLATLLALISAIVILIAFLAKNRICAKVAGVFMIIVMILLLVSFFQFFRINGAFREDDPLCNGNPVASWISSLFVGDADDTYCHKFMGSNEDELIKLSFSPYVGFWLVIGGVFFSLFVFIPLFKTSNH